MSNNKNGGIQWSRRQLESMTEEQVSDFIDEYCKDKLNFNIESFFEMREIWRGMRGY